MNKQIEHAVIDARETAAVTHERVVFITGDLVKIRSDGKKHAGAIGAVIGVKYCGAGKYEYTIKLSDEETTTARGDRLHLVSCGPKKATQRKK